jgi:hypothetical protein
MKQVLGTEEARQGKTHQGVRYVLAISVALVIAGFAIVYIAYFV